MHNIREALNKAYELHENQTRKGSDTPYIVHIFDVFKYLSSEPGLSEKVIIAGILHDTLEDTDYTEDDLQNEFGEKILGLVKFASEPDNKVEISNDDKKASWRSRKQHTIDICQNGTEEEVYIVLADKLANLNSIHEDLQIMGDEVWGRFNAQKNDIGWYYKSLGDCFRTKLPETRMFKLYDGLIQKVFS